MPQKKPHKEPKSINPKVEKFKKKDDAKIIEGVDLLIANLLGIAPHYEKCDNELKKHLRTKYVALEKAKIIYDIVKEHYVKLL